MRLCILNSWKDPYSINIDSGSYKNTPISIKLKSQVTIDHEGLIGGGVLEIWFLWDFVGYDGNGFLIEDENLKKVKYQAVNTLMDSFYMCLNKPIPMSKVKAKEIVDNIDFNKVMEFHINEHKQYLEDLKIDLECQ